MERAQFTLQQMIPSLKGSSHREKPGVDEESGELHTPVSQLRRAELVRKIYA